MRFQVTIKESVYYDVEVEAETFDQAVAMAHDAGVHIAGEIIEAVNPLVPEGVLLDSETDITGVHKL